VQKQQCWNSSARPNAFTGLQQEGVPVKCCNEVFFPEPDQKMVVNGRFGRNFQIPKVFLDPVLQDFDAVETSLFINITEYGLEILFWIYSSIQQQAL
jgi:hypothetical protein